MEAAAVTDSSLAPRIGRLVEALSEAVVTTDTAYRVTGWNSAAERLFGLSRGATIGVSVLEILIREPRSRIDAKAALDRAETWTGGAAIRDAAGASLELRLTAAPIGGRDALEGYVVVAHDITAQVRAERTAERADARFAEFMAASPAIAFIKDREGRYVFANDHVLRLTGDRKALSWQGKTDYELWPPAVAAHIRDNDGMTLAGAAPLEFVQIVPLGDGPHTLLTYQFPLRAATGEPLLGGIALDITERVRADAEVERGQEREVHASTLAAERAVVAEALSRLRAGGSVEAIATAIAESVLSLPGVEFAAVVLFETHGPATFAGLAHAAGPVSERPRVPLTRSRELRRQAQKGPWVEAWRPTARHPLAKMIRALDIGTFGYAPIHSGDNLVGLLVVGAAGQSGETAVTERLPAIVEFAGLAGALLGSSVAVRQEVRRVRRAIRAVIDDVAFQPAFQPIVELAGGTTVGYEALTRFRDGVPPDTKFAEAAEVGLGAELELATLGAALRAADQLPAGLWLNVNVSPALVLAGESLCALLCPQDRPIVCEVTEHTEIEDYAAFRAAVANLDGIRIAVDDAGAGFSSLRHILELRPAFVKLDRSLVAGIDGDPLRQALVVGMRHFALSASCRLIAEGIETEAEMATLRKLQVPLGQGYLLGGPKLAGAD